MMVNIQVAWVAFFVGALAGAAPGLFFHRAEWLGGYGSWPRRLIRLGHIAFFGLGLLNLGFALTARSLGIEDGLAWPGALLIVAVATMSPVCYLSAWKPVCRHLFGLPAGAVLIAIGLFTWRIFQA